MGAAPTFPWCRMASERSRPCFSLGTLASSRSLTWSSSSRPDSEVARSTLRVGRASSAVRSSSFRTRHGARREGVPHRAPARGGALRRAVGCPARARPASPPAAAARWLARPAAAAIAERPWPRGRARAREARDCWRRPECSTRFPSATGLSAAVVQRQILTLMLSGVLAPDPSGRLVLSKRSQPPDSSD